MGADNAAALQNVGQFPSLRFGFLSFGDFGLPVNRDDRGWISRIETANAIRSLYGMIL